MHIPSVQTHEASFKSACGQGHVSSTTFLSSLSIALESLSESSNGCPSNSFCQLSKPCPSTGRAKFSRPRTISPLPWISTDLWLLNERAKATVKKAERPRLCLFLPTPTLQARVAFLSPFLNLGSSEASVT